MKGMETIHMSRYEVVHNARPNKVLLVTDSLDEACYFVTRNAVRAPLRLFGEPLVPGNKFQEAPPMLAPEVGTIETEWYADSEPGKTRNSHVIMRDGHAIMMSDSEVMAHAKAWRTKVLDPMWDRAFANRYHGSKKGAVRWYQRGNAHRRTMRLDDEHDDECPRIRPGARVPDAWDVRDGPVKTSKSWKDQSKRRRQWKPIDMPEQEHADDGGGTSGPERDGKTDGHVDGQGGEF